MTQDRTVPHRAASVPVRTLRVEVLEGPDTGGSHTAPAETLSVGTAEGNDLVLTDATVSRYHLELVRREDGVLVVDHGSTNGTFVGPARVERATVPAGTVLGLGKSRLRVVDGETVSVALYQGETLCGIYGRAPAMRRLMVDLERAARSDLSILIVGESGTGKELVARAAHQLGPRASAPFVTVDCGALAPTLVASELFGHEKGAFTGAERRHTGAFESANGGTVFLDEIGELPAATQAALLGVIERRRFRRVGGSTEIAVDVRVVAATHRDLRAEVNAGTFRLDLYYRLAAVIVQVPPLRERAEDIPLLVEHFLRACGHDGPIDDLVSPAAMSTLVTHRWPGNVRELRNVIEATVAMGEPPPMPSEGIHRGGGASSSAGGPDAIEPLLALPYRAARTQLLEAFERRYVEKLLDRNQGNVASAARQARMDRSYLFDLIKRHKLRE